MGIPMGICARRIALEQFYPSKKNRKLGFNAPKVIKLCATIMAEWVTLAVDGDNQFSQAAFWSFMKVRSKQGCEFDMGSRGGQPKTSLSTNT